MHIMVTGGSGFLGSKLALEFLSLGHQVSLLLRPTSGLDRLGEHKSQFTIRRAATDLELQEFVCRVIPDAVVHTACCYGRYGESTLELCDTNYRLGLMIMQAVLATKRSVTFINTGTVLDPQVSLYALTKHQFSQTGHLLATAPHSKLRFINVLLEHMYGPGDDETKFTTHVIQACRRNLAELNLTIGTQERDFIYVDDVVSAYVTLLNQAGSFGSSANIEVGSGVALPVREFVETVHRLTGSSTQLNFGAVPFKSNEVMNSKADISEMKSLGWAPKFNLEAGIRKTLELEV